MYYLNIYVEFITCWCILCALESMAEAKSKLIQWIDNVEKRIDGRSCNVEKAEVMEAQRAVWKNDEKKMNDLIKGQVKKVSFS